MTKDLQIIKELESRFEWFNYELNSDKEVTEFKLISFEVYNNKFLENDLELIGELTSLITLTLNCKTISTIQGLEKLTNLRELCLGWNKITTIEGLGLDKFTKLKHLGLYHNKITKIQGLDKLTNLRGLNLGCNYITKIEGLDNLKNLGYLNLSTNNIPEKEIKEFRDKHPKIIVL